MKKAGITIFLGALLLILAGQVYYYNFGNSNIAVAGNVISNVDVPFTNLSLTTVILIVQGVVIAIVLFGVIFQTIRHKKEEKDQIKVFSLVQHKKSKSETDLDLLYEMVKKKNKVDVSSVAKLFKVSSEVALEWGKILENKNLVSMDYPFLSSPQIILKEESGKNDEIKNNVKKEDMKDEKEKQKKGEEVKGKKSVQIKSSEKEKESKFASKKSKK